MPDSSTEVGPTLSSRLKAACQEATAAAVWLYALIKLLVFDVDVHLFERYAPDYRWLLDIKAFLLLAGVAVLWLALGKKGFVPFLAYVLAYPLILLFWRLPLAALARWPLVIAFAPALHRAITTFRSAFLLYTAALLAALAIASGRHPSLLTAAMVVLGVFLVAHLYRAFRKVYASSVFTDLTKLARKFRVHVEGGNFDSSLGAESPRAHGSAPEAAQPAPGVTSATPQTFSPLTIFYVYPSLAAIVAEKVSQVARGRKYDLYLIASWLYTVITTAIVFAFEYLALQRIDPGSFRSAEQAGFWSFFGFSLGILTTSSVSQISPVSAPAAILCYMEVVGSVLMLVILAFTILTAAREAFRQDVEEFSRELGLVGDAFEQRAMDLVQLSMAQMESELIQKQAGMVKWLRRHRGLSELPPARQPHIVDRSTQTGQKALDPDPDKPGDG